MQVIFALLVEVFAKTGNTFHKDNDTPNVSCIADEMIKIAKVDKIKICKSSIEKAIRAARKVKNENINSKP